MPHEIESCADSLPGSIAVVENADEPVHRCSPAAGPFTEPCGGGMRGRHSGRAKSGRPRRDRTRARTSDGTEKAGDVLPHPAADGADPPRGRDQTSEGSRQDVRAARRESRAFTAPCYNTVADLPGAEWSGGVAGARRSPGHLHGISRSRGRRLRSGRPAGGRCACLPTAQRELGISSGMGIRACTWSGEEQNHQGSAAYVRQHYGPEPDPRFVVNLDELSAGPMKGVVLQFPHLRGLVQGTLDELGEGLKCHVMPVLDHTNDGFSFARSAIPYAILWRWRFVGRHPRLELPGRTMGHRRQGADARAEGVRRVPFTIPPKALPRVPGRLAAQSGDGRGRRGPTAAGEVGSVGRTM